MKDTRRNNRVFILIGALLAVSVLIITSLASSRIDQIEDRERSENFGWTLEELLQNQDEFAPHVEAEVRQTLLGLEGTTQLLADKFGYDISKEFEEGVDIAELTPSEAEIFLLAIEFKLIIIGLNANLSFIMLRDASLILEDGADAMGAVIPPSLDLSIFTVDALLDIVHQASKSIKRANEIVERIRKL